MNLKKLTSLLLALIMMMSLAVCANAEPDTVTVSTVYGDVEVPYAPERVCVLNSAILDTIHTLGLGEYVTVAAQAKKVPDYLSDYYNSDAIMLLESGEKKKDHDDEASAEPTPEATEAVDPYEMYYIIDADVIFTTTSSNIDEDLYNVLSQLAPTVVLDSGVGSENLYGSVKENAMTVASIWGVEERAEEMFATYDELYSSLSAELSGKTFIDMESSLSRGSLEVEELDDDAVAATICRQMGMTALNVNIPEEVLAAAESGGHGGHGGESASETETVDQSANNLIIANWIDASAPDYVFLTDKGYTDIEAARAEGVSCAELDGLTAYKEGRICQLTEVKLMNLGLGGIVSILDTMSAFFLN